MKNKINELHLIAMFEQACATQGLTGDKIGDAAEAFVEIVHKNNIQIKTPKGVHLAIGTVDKK